MTVELAHPSTEPSPSRSPVEPAHPRWWFARTTPGRILTIGVILAALGILSAFATSTTINDRQQQLNAVLNHTEPLAFAAGQLYTTRCRWPTPPPPPHSSPDPRPVRCASATSRPSPTPPSPSPGGQRVDRRTPGGAAGPDQRPAGGVHRPDRDRLDQQPDG